MFLRLQQPHKTPVMVCLKTVGVSGRRISADYDNNQQQSQAFAHLWGQSLQIFWSENFPWNLLLKISSLPIFWDRNERGKTLIIMAKEEIPPILLQKNPLDSPPQNYRHFTFRRQSLTQLKKTLSIFCCKWTPTGTSTPSTDLSYSEDYNKVLPSCGWDAKLWQKNNTANNWPSCVRQSDRWKPERNRRHPAAPARWWSGPTVGTRSRIVLVHGTAACSPSDGQTPAAPGWTHWHTHT